MWLMQKHCKCLPRAEIILQSPIMEIYLMHSRILTQQFHQLHTINNKERIHYLENFNLFVQIFLKNHLQCLNMKMLQHMRLKDLRYQHLLTCLLNWDKKLLHNLIMKRTIMLWLMMKRISKISSRLNTWKLKTKLLSLRNLTTLRIQKI